MSMPFSFIYKTLIQQFLKTRINNKYIECTRTKISKLLAIIQMVHIKAMDSIAFQEPIYIDKCGVTIPALAASGVPYAITEEVMPRLFDEDKKYFICNDKLRADMLDTSGYEIPQKYTTEIVNYSEKQLEIINNVFLEFGGYESIELGKMLDEFKYDISDEGNIINTDLLTQCIKSAFSNKYKDNKIINYIINY